MSESNDISVEKTATEFRIELELEGHRIEIEGHQGIFSNQYRLYVDGIKTDDVTKAMGTHHLRGMLPGSDGGPTRPFAVALEGSFRNTTFLEFEGKRIELLKSWVA